MALVRRPSAVLALRRATVSAALSRASTAFPKRASDAPPVSRRSTSSLAAPNWRQASRTSVSGEFGPMLRHSWRGRAPLRRRVPRPGRQDASSTGPCPTAAGFWPAPLAARRGGTEFAELLQQRHLPFGDMRQGKVAGVVVGDAAAPCQRASACCVQDVAGDAQLESDQRRRTASCPSWPDRRGREAGRPQRTPRPTERPTESHQRARDVSRGSLPGMCQA